MTIMTRMPTISVLREPTPQQTRQITKLYRMAGWWTMENDDPGLVARIVAGSHLFMVASDGTEIVAMGRAISDNAADAYIQDVAVKKEYRRCGIGAKIVEKLVESLCADGICWIGLIAEKGSRDFYGGLGFETMTESTPMIWKRRHA